MSAAVRNAIVPFLSGVVFAVGLVLGGMTQPAKVIGFLDFFGNWDPSLMLVMGGAIAVYFPVYRLFERRTIPGMVQDAKLPTSKVVDVRLLGGAAVFGVGWGLGGYCPGPGIVSLASGATRAIAFVVAMAAGMIVFRLVDGARRRRGSTRPPAPVPHAPPTTTEAR